MGDWGLGIGDWGLGPIPNPQSPIPNPQSPIPKYLNLNVIKFIQFKIKNIKIMENNGDIEIVQKENEINIRYDHLYKSI